MPLSRKFSYTAKPEDPARRVGGREREDLRTEQLSTGNVRVEIEQNSSTFLPVISINVNLRIASISRSVLFISRKFCSSAARSCRVECFLRYVTNCRPSSLLQPAFCSSGGGAILREFEKPSSSQISTLMANILWFGGVFVERDLRATHMHFIVVFVCLASHLLTSGMLLPENFTKGTPIFSY